MTTASLIGSLQTAMHRHPDRLAIADGLTSLTFTALWAAACRLAEAIAAAVPAGTPAASRPVAIILPNTTRYPVAWIACRMLGRVAALLDADYPAERTRQCLEVARPGAVIAATDSEATQSLAPGLAAIPIEAAFAHTPPPMPPAAPHPAGDDPAFLIFTSGSTGRPKAVALGEAAVLNRAATLIATLSTGPDDAILSMVPPSALGGMLNLCEALFAGAALLKLDLRRTPLAALADRRITMLFATPALLRAIAQLDPAGEARRHLRVVQPVGEALLRSDLAALRALLPPGCAILNTYGSTEALAGLQWIIPDPYPLPGARIASGYANPGYRCLIQRPDGTPAADGEEGELVLASPHMALGEWRDGALHPGPFAADPAAAGSRLYRTGDIALRHADGLIAVLGRLDRQIKIRGNRIEPAEIEEVLRAVPGVAQVAVAALPRAADPELIAFIVPAFPDDAFPDDAAPGNAAPLAEVAMQAARRHLPGPMVPSRVLPVPALKLLPGGKIDLLALLADAGAPSADML